MGIEIKPISLDGVRLGSIVDRKAIESVDKFAHPWRNGKVIDLIKSMPDVLAAKDLKEIINSIVIAKRNKKPLVLAMGAHVIKVGLGPIIIDLMKNNIIDAIAVNGAGVIHDVEFAMVGRSSEDVAESIKDGTFGMVRETGDFIHTAINLNSDKGFGLAVGAALDSMTPKYFKFSDYSILHNAFKLNVPVTVHVAIGTDTIHSHPKASGAEIGRASHVDFRKFASIISNLEGGVYINLGSAVILPEVFLKAISLVRNLGTKVENFTTVNMDFIRQYRPMSNVVNRPGGKGYHITGHHEIMFPLLAAAIIEESK